MNRNYLLLRENAIQFASKKEQRGILAIVFDMPLKGSTSDDEATSIVLLPGPSADIYRGDGGVLSGLEKNPAVYPDIEKLFMEVSRLFKSADFIKTEDFTFKKRSRMRIFIKTTDGVYYNDLDKAREDDKELLDLVSSILYRSDPFRPASDAHENQAHEKLQAILPLLLVLCLIMPSVILILFTHRSISREWIFILPAAIGIVLVVWTVIKMWKGKI